MHVRAVLLAAALLAVITPLHAQDESELTLDPALAAPRAPATGLPTSVRAAEELRAEETQRILGVVPEFNITDIHDAAPLSTGQKFQLALKSSVDPFTFVADSNVLGNIAAGGIANSYYPANERGAALTFQRAFTVTAEGTIGNVFFEFWPDVSRKLLTRKKRLQS